MHTVRIRSSVPHCICLMRFVRYVACTTNITISISFGGSDWAIDPADMVIGNMGGNSSQMCIGAILSIPEADPDSSLPSWVIGSVFLSNVYSVFQANPPAVGFAQLTSASGNSGAFIWYFCL